MPHTTTEQAELHQIAQINAGSTDHVILTTEAAIRAALDGRHIRRIEPITAPTIGIIFRDGTWMSVTAANHHGPQFSQDGKAIIPNGWDGTIPVPPLTGVDFRHGWIGFRHRPDLWDKIDVVGYCDWTPLPIRIAQFRATTSIGTLTLVAEFHRLNDK